MMFSIRAVREEDAESIAELLNPIIEAGKYTIMEERVSLDEMTDFIREYPERGVSNVAICHETRRVLGLQEVIPFSTAENALKHIGEISTFVSLDSQRKGIGRSLSEMTFREAKERGFLKIMATIRADNPQAISFYSSQGFNTIGTARNHALARGKYIDEIIMEKWIG